MTSLPRVALGVAALAGAALLGVLDAGEAPRDPAAALGGGRTVATGILFLRAEALRREGRTDEMAAVYRRILEIDPGNDAGADHLAETLSRDLLPLAPTPEGRVRWWREAFALTGRALERVPDSQRLLYRRADLCLFVAARDPAVAEALAKEGRDPEREGFESLLAAVRVGPEIPGRGRIHLDVVARAAPWLAATRLARGGDPRPFLDGGEETLRRAEGVLDEIILDPGDRASAAVRLRAGLRLVAHVAAALDERPPRAQDARDLLDAYARTLGEDRVTAALKPLLP